MIGLLFEFAGEIIEIRIRGHDLTFKSSAYGGISTTIEHLKLSQEGVIKEFPELKDKENWREQAIIKFKAKIKEINSEQRIAEYLINDLKKYGYVPRYKQIQGHRVEAII